MNDSHSDALVFFSASGDLAYKTAIGVAKASWDLDQLRARAHDGLERHGGE